MGLKEAFFKKDKNVDVKKRLSTNKKTVALDEMRSGEEQIDFLNDDDQEKAGTDRTVSLSQNSEKQSLDETINTPALTQTLL